MTTRALQDTVTINTTGQGLYEFTDAVAEIVRRSGCVDGVCTVFVRHTSASLIIQENADPSVQRDLQAFLKRLVPEGDALYTHTAEGPDDMPAHVKAALTAVSLAIPVTNGALALGTWQGIYLWEHRTPASAVVRCARELARIMHELRSENQLRGGRLLQTN